MSQLEIPVIDEAEDELQDLELEAEGPLHDRIEEIVTPPLEFFKKETPHTPSTLQILNSPQAQKAALDGLDTNELSIEEYMDIVPKLESEEAIYAAALRSKTLDQAKYFFRFILNKDLLQQAISSKSAEFTKLSEEDRHGLTRWLNELRDSRSNVYSLDIQSGSLKSRSENKFVIIQSKNGKRLQIESVEKTPNHADIVREAWQPSTAMYTVNNPLADPKQILDISGGFLDWEKAEDGTFSVRFYSKSGLYGPYNARFLNQYQESLQEHFAELWDVEKEKVRILIETSS